MASTDVQVEDGYTRIANRLLTAIALAPWDTGSQANVVLALVRVTYGLHQKDAPVGYAQWRKLTGLSDATLARALASLQRNNVIRCVREHDSAANKPRVWRLEKRWTHWQRFRVCTDDIDVAEAIAAQLLRLIPPPVGDPGVKVGLSLNLTPGSPTTPDQGSNLTRGHGQQPYSPNGSQPPKDSKDSSTKEKLPSGAKRKGGSKKPLPDGWAPNEKHRAIAAEEGLDMRRQEALFRDHAETHGRRLLSWDAGFRMWLRKANEMGTGPPGGRRQTVKSPTNDLRKVSQQRGYGAQ